MLLNTSPCYNLFLLLFFIIARHLNSAYLITQYPNRKTEKLYEVHTIKLYMTLTIKVIRKAKSIYINEQNPYDLYKSKVRKNHR